MNSCPHYFTSRAVGAKRSHEQRLRVSVSGVQLVPTIVVFHTPPPAAAMQRVVAIVGMAARRQSVHWHSAYNR